MTDALSSIEALARAIHEDEAKAATSVGSCSVTVPRDGGKPTPLPSFDECPEKLQRLRREQARLMFERIMR